MIRCDSGADGYSPDVKKVHAFQNQACYCQQVAIVNTDLNPVGF
jgi:hypothetical protein